MPVFFLLKNNCFIIVGMKRKVIIEDGQRYLIYQCGNCRNEIKIRVNSNMRGRVMGRCPECGLRFEVVIGPF